MTLKILLPLAALAVRALTAATLNVPAGGDLQGALNSAHSGDTIQLAAGASFTGHFYLPVNPGSQWITIQSSAMSSLPAAGTRVSNTQANLMPKLITPDNIPVLIMSTGANYYRIQGVEITVAPGVYDNDTVQVGNGSETSVAALPHDIDFDRDYIHGDPVTGSKRGIALNGANVTVENCYLSAFTSNWQDTQAIAGWNGPGPFKIVNNYLEAGTEIVAFGGATTSISGLIPSDITIQNNTFLKPLTWMPGSATFNGMHVWAKNHIELKNAQRVKIDSNTFDNNWVGADQRGFVMVFNVRCESGAVPWAVVNNVTVTHNTIRHAAAGMVLIGQDSASNGEGAAGGFFIQDNLFDDINSNWGGDGRLFQIQANVQGITIDHNTTFSSGYLMVFDSGPSYNINFTNNIANIGWGVAGNGFGTPTSTMAYYSVNGTYTHNAIIGGSANGYPAGNYYPGSMSQVGFTDYVNANYTLAASSPYRNAGSDGQDLGDVVTPTIPTGWVSIVNKNSGSCLDIMAWNGSEKQIGTHLQQWACWGGLMQQFQLTPVTGGYKITNRASGYQLDVAYASTNDGTPIVQYPFWGGANEVFTLVNAGGGYYSIHPLDDGKCIDVWGLSTANGAAVTQYSCNGGTNQQFKLVTVQ